MKKIHIAVGIIATVIALSAVNGAVAMWSHRETVTTPLDLSAVSKIRVNGAASEITLSGDYSTVGQCRCQRL